MIEDFGATGRGTMLTPIWMQQFAASGLYFIACQHGHIAAVKLKFTLTRAGILPALQLWSKRARTAIRLGFRSFVILSHREKANISWWGHAFASSPLLCSDGHCTMRMASDSLFSCSKETQIYREIYANGLPLESSAPSMCTVFVIRIKPAMFLETKKNRRGNMAQHWAELLQEKQLGYLQWAWLLAP